MSVVTSVYQRKLTGERYSEECCPSDGMAKHSQPITPNECLKRLLSRSKKMAVTFTNGVFTVPAGMVDEVRGISHGNAQGYDINMLCANDEGADVVALAPYVIHECQVLSIYEANTTATNMFIWF